MGKSKKKMDSLERALGEIRITANSNYVEGTSIVGRANGGTASVSARLVNSFVGRWGLISKIKGTVGITQLMKLKIAEEPLVYPTPAYLEDAVCTENVELAKLASLLDAEKSPEFETPYLHISDFLKAYREKTATPLTVANTIIGQLEEDLQIKNQLNAVIEFHKDEIIQAATASTERYAAGSEKSVLDGVPFFVKEEVPIAGYTNNFGTTGFVEGPCTKTATVVQKLLEAGAVLMGITKMSYFGFGTIGFNPSEKHGVVRNPHNPDYYSGGSSTGSAAVVSAGLCPFSIGVDGLGSNRIPPSVTGVVGLRSTYGRVSNANFQHAEESYTVCGPITSCVQDAAIVYGAIAGPDPLFEIGLKQPKVELADLNVDAEQLKKIKFGYDSSFTKLSMDDEITLAIDSAVQKIREMGCQVLDHCVAECAETVAAMSTIIIHDQAKSMTASFKSKIPSMECSNAIILLAVGSEVTKAEYEQACKQRTRSINVVKDLFSKFDILITPCVGGANLKIEDGDEKNGVLDDVSTSRLTRFSALSSLTGIPAISINIGHKKADGMPIAIQLQSKWWSESVLLQVAYKLEQLVAPKAHKQPQIFRKLI